MHRIHVIICCLIFFIIFAISYYFNIKINEVRSDMLTVISIIFGFTITGLSIMIGQDFSKKLNNKVDSKSSLKQTQLQTLSKYFYFSFILGITTIILLIVSGVISYKNHIVWFSLFIRIFRSIIWGLFAVNFFTIILLWKVLIKSFYESAK